MSNDLNNSRFVFVGELITTKEPLVTQKIGDKGWKKTRMSVGVKVDQNTQFLNLEYIHKDDVTTCKLLGSDMESFEVKLSDTNKEDVISKAADFICTTVDLETDFDKKKEYMKLVYKKRNHEMKKDEDKTDEDISKAKEYGEQIKELADNRMTFCHIKDVMNHLNSNLPKIKGKKVKVLGNIKSNFYNGKNTLQYVPTSIELAEEDSEEMLRAYMDVFFEKDSLDDDKKEQKFYVNGYVGEKVNKKLKLYPTTVVIDYTKLDLKNDQHLGLLDFLKKTFEIKDKKQVHRIGVEISVVNGREEVEFDESQLTELQRQQILFGQATLDDFKPKGASYGDRIQELKVIRADLKKFPDGSEEVFPVKELEDYLAANDGDVTKDKLKSNKDEDKEKKSSEDKKEDIMAALFG